LLPETAVTAEDRNISVIRSTGAYSWRATLQRVKDARIAGRNHLDRRIEEAASMAVEKVRLPGRRPIWLSVDFGGVSAFPKSLGNDYIYGLHPLFHSAFRKAAVPTGAMISKDFFSVAS